MQLEPIVNAKLKSYISDYELSGLDESLAFERFVNYTLLQGHQPEAFNGDSELLDTICVGGKNDMGIDGIAIKINGLLVKSSAEALSIIELHHKADIEFIFIQSKFKRHFDSSEYGKFVDGIVDFLGDYHNEPHNEKIDYWLTIKDYLFSDDVIAYWRSNPIIRIYYVVMGQWQDNRHILGKYENCKQAIASLNSYDDVNCSFIDTTSFKKICDENENKFSVVLDTIDSSPLPEISNVDSSTIILCTGNELMKMLVTDEKLIRSSLFNDNVRDYQGDTIINNEMYETIKNSTEFFALFNNGITVICDDSVVANRKVTIKNPQVVNGCQTCNVLFRAYKDGLPVDKIVVTIKVIATRDYDIINNIVKGTNRQNIVYDEAFEITKQFHKDLESLFLALSEKEAERIYYERRSKQYKNNPLVKPYQKVTFKNLIQSFVAVFIEQPYRSHLHESRLLKDFENKIFIETQSKYPYYVSALLFNKLEKLYRERIIPDNRRAYKAQLAYLVKVLSMGKSPNINKEKQIDEYCTKLHEIINNRDTFNATVGQAIGLFNSALDEQITLHGKKYIYSVKESKDFFEILSKKAAESSTVDNQEILEETPLQYRGTVQRILSDRNGREYGFISRLPRDIFFHIADNPELEFWKSLYKEVTYDIKIDPITQQERAYNVTIL